MDYGKASQTTRSENGDLSAVRCLNILFIFSPGFMAEAHHRVPLNVHNSEQTEHICHCIHNILSPEWLSLSINWFPE